jgi:hypothetical protein
VSSDILAAIDGAIDDYETSVDAMRWQPDGGGTGQPHARVVPIPASSGRVFLSLPRPGPIPCVGDTVIVAGGFDGSGDVETTVTAAHCDGTFTVAVGAEEVPTPDAVETERAAGVERSAPPAAGWVGTYVAENAVPLATVAEDLFVWVPIESATRIPVELDRSRSCGDRIDIDVAMRPTKSIIRRGYRADAVLIDECAAFDAPELAEHVATVAECSGVTFDAAAGMVQSVAEAFGDGATKAAELSDAFDPPSRATPGAVSPKVPAYRDSRPRWQSPYGPARRR